MKSRTLVVALAAVLVLTSCSNAPEAEAEPSEHPDHAVCAHYVPDADGKNPETAQSIIDLYLSGNASPDTVNPVFYSVKDLENDATDDGVKAAVAGFNAPVYNMKDAMSSGQSSFSNQWDAVTAAANIMEACAAIGYEV